MKRQPTCLMQRQTKEIQESVQRMSKHETFANITDWLAEQGITATWSQVRYFINKTTPKRRDYIVPTKKTYAEKLAAYINELLGSPGKTFTIHSIHLRGSSWTVVTRRLHEDRLIVPMRKYTPIRWRILASREDIQKWYENELTKLGMYDP